MNLTITTSSGNNICSDTIAVAVDYMLKYHKVMHIAEQIHYKIAMGNHTYTVGIQLFPHISVKLYKTQIEVCTITQFYLHCESSLLHCEADLIECLRKRMLAYVKPMTNVGQAYTYR